MRERLARLRDRLADALARRRVPLGFVFGALVLWLARPTRWFAHPLYVGSSVMGAGLAVASRRVTVAALVAIYLIATLTAAIGSEEAFLRRRFGDRYDLYRRASVRGPAEAGARRSFSLQQAIANREHRAAIGLVVALLLLLWKTTYN
jgi:hypothetical protein